MDTMNDNNPAGKQETSGHGVFTAEMPNNVCQKGCWQQRAHMGKMHTYS
jgi:hypothetical protein